MQVRLACGCWGVSFQRALAGPALHPGLLSQPISANNLRGSALTARLLFFRVVLEAAPPRAAGAGPTGCWRLLPQCAAR